MVTNQPTRRRTLGFGTYNTDSHPRVGVILEGLRDGGDLVRELNAPLSSSTKDRVAALSGSKAALKFFTDLGSSWGKLIRGRAAYRGRYAPDIVVVGYLGHFDVLLARALFPRTTIVLDHLIFAADTAKDRGATGGLLGRALTLLDKLAIKAADIVVFDTVEHARMAPSGTRGVVVPVGAPDEWFDQDPQDRDGVVFYGLYTPLQGAPTIGRALAILAERGVRVPVTMIGSGQDLEETKRAADGAEVTWIDWVDAHDLPGLVASHEISLGIFGTTAKATRVVPNKVYQGLAAGCAVITSDTRAQRDMLGQTALFVEPGNALQLADAIENLVSDPDRVAQLKARGRKLALDRFRPGTVVLPLLAELDSFVLSGGAHDRLASR